MNPITKCVNKILAVKGIKTNSVHSCTNKLTASKNAVYTESGWTTEVEILVNDSDEEHYRYTLRVIQTLTDGYLGHLHDGHIFNVFAVKKYAACCGWRLSVAGF